MCRIKISILILAIITVFLSLFTSCNSVSETASANSDASTEDIEAMSAKISELESRIEQLEQGLDPRVVEYNMVKSALWEMIIDNELCFMESISDYTYTNDMRQFPSPETPLYGFDKDGDGQPDTNYVPFEKTTWFYICYDYYPEFLYQGIDPELVETWESVIHQREIEEQETERHNVQTAVMAGMADGGAGTVSGSGVEVFGNTGHATSPPYTGTDCLITDGIYVGDYIVGGAENIAGSYTIEADGTVIQVWFP